MVAWILSEELIINNHNMTMKKQLTVTDDYNSPQVEIICKVLFQGPLCGSFQGAEIPKYDEEDIFGNN
jgi:hypothetical protein